MESVCRKFTLQLPAPAESLFHEPVMQRVSRQVNVGGQTHLLGYPRAVSPHGFFTQRQLGGDFLDRAAGGDHPQHLKLTINHASRVPPRSAVTRPARSSALKDARMAIKMDSATTR
jgi:hypothetical protein